MTLKKENVKGVGFALPITLELEEDTGVYTVAIDGVAWIDTEVQHHAVVMFHMLKDHVSEYMHYEQRK